MTMTTSMTVSEWARSLGISKQAGHQAVARCGIPVEDGRVDPDVATALYQKRTRPRARTKEAPSSAAVAAGQGGYLASRARREAAEAKLAELKLGEVAGELVRADDVRAECARLATALRNAFLQMPDRLAPVLAAETEPSRVHALLMTEIRQVLTQLADAA